MSVRRNRPEIPPPILRGKDHRAFSVFTPEALLREARRQKAAPAADVPEICVLDPDGDIVEHLVANGAATRFAAWACYHTDLYAFEGAGARYGVIGSAVGASFAVLVAEQLFASGCRLLVSVTSAGQILPVRPPPYFVVIDRALRDEGTSYHYMPTGDFSLADTRLVETARNALSATGMSIEVGPTWTTDAPFRETAGRDRGRQGYGRPRGRDGGGGALRLCRRQDGAPCFVSPTSPIGWDRSRATSKRARSAARSPR